MVMGKECPSCDSNNIGKDHWGMFEADKDWFYYCKECDYTFRDDTVKLTEEERKVNLF